MTIVIFPGAPAAAVGRLLVKPRAVIAAAFGFVRVIVSVVLAPARIDAAPKASVMEGGASTLTSSAVELLGLYVTDLVPFGVVRSGSR